MKHLPPVKNYHAKKWDERAHQDRKKLLELRFWAAKNRQALETMRLAIPNHLKNIPISSWKSSPTGFITILCYDYTPLLYHIAVHPEIKNAFRVGIINDRREEMLEWLEERGLTKILRPVNRTSGVDLLFEDATQAMLFKMTFF